MKPNNSPVSAFVMYNKLRNANNKTSPVSKKKGNLTTKGKNNKRTGKGKKKAGKTSNTNGNLKVNMKAKNKQGPSGNASKKSLGMAFTENLKQKKIMPGENVNVSKSNKEENVKPKQKTSPVPEKPIRKTSPVPGASNVEQIANFVEHSITYGEEIFAWMIEPYDLKMFFKQKWEKLPVMIKRNKSTYYSWLVSCEEINKALRKDSVFFTKNIDITSYNPETGVRETHNPPGRAHAPLVWDYYANGCSVRMLNPQTFFKKVNLLATSLQEYFECFVGANLYLTPPGTQGFAPHYDDIEAFVVQIEGSKLWKVYAPR